MKIVVITKDGKPFERLFRMRRMVSATIPVPIQVIAHLCNLIRRIPEASRAPNPGQRIRSRRAQWTTSRVNNFNFDHRNYGYRDLGIQIDFYVISCQEKMKQRMHSKS